METKRLRRQLRLGLCDCFQTKISGHPNAIYALNENVLAEHLRAANTAV
jgi:hypothetical protein